MAQFAEGNTVRLKSGGPLMTVIEVGNYNFGQGAKCQWFDKDENVKEKVFPVTALDADDGTPVVA